MRSSVLGLLLLCLVGPARASDSEPSSKVLSFRPSSHGLPFANSFRVKIEIPLGFTSWEVSADFGLCGGMIHQVLDAWEAGEAIDRSQALPKVGSAPYWGLVRRQTETLVPGVWAKILSWQQRPSRDRWWCPMKSLRRLVPRELREIEAQIDDGAVVPVCLIRRFGFSNPSYNHQVLVYGYEREGRTTTLRLYDPNHPNDDSITLKVTVGRQGLSLQQSSGERNRGLFVL